MKEKLTSQMKEKEVFLMMILQGKYGSIWKKALSLMFLIFIKYDLTIPPKIGIYYDYHILLRINYGVNSKAVVMN
ncbi:hypothetical protein CR513_09479, partial [Mucuna pruriens]